MILKREISHEVSSLFVFCLKLSENRLVTYILI